MSRSYYEKDGNAMRTRRFIAPTLLVLVLTALVSASPSEATGRPSIASFAPATGPVGTPVVINGSSLSRVAGVAIGGRTARFIAESDNRIIAAIPAHATRGPISVSYPEGESISDAPFQPSAPNIVMILTDDQTAEELNAAAMPTASSELIGKGVTFANGFVVNPLCCPSRATILTGKYSHSTDVYDNTPPHGGFSTFGSQDQSTVATWLHDAGYATGLVGKYLNGYSDPSYVPRGWDTWNALLVGDGSSGGYYNYTLSVGGTPEKHGSADSDYATDVLAADATAFINSVPSGQPLFLDFTPHAPHAPVTPPKRYAKAFSDLAPLRLPNYNEADVSDKPAWVGQLKLLSRAQQRALDDFRKNQYRTLLAVDDAVADILNALETSGRLSTTFILFTSDNGMELGSHRWDHKQVVWEEAARIPLVVRYDPLTNLAARSDTNLALNLDFAPTFADVAGVNAPGAEGLSLLPLFQPNPPTLRSDFLIEHFGGNVPTYCAVRTSQYKYVEYQSHEEELYDLVADPYELRSKDKDQGYATVKSQLRARLLNLCSPPPPGFTP